MIENTFMNAPRSNGNVNIRHAGEDVNSSYVDKDLADGASFNYNTSHEFGDITVDGSNFDVIDRNNDNEINRDEFKDYNEMQGYSKNSDSMQAFDKEMGTSKAFGSNHTSHSHGGGDAGIGKTLDASEVSGSIKVDSENFHQFDTDGDDQITKVEMQSKLEAMHINLDGIMDIVGEEGTFYKVAGADGVISRAELLNLDETSVTEEVTEEVVSTDEETTA